MSRTKLTTMSFLLSALSPFVTFDSDYALISSPLCKLHNLWNIFYDTRWNVEQDETMCRVQE